MCGRYLFTEAESEDIQNIINDVESRTGEGTVKRGEIFPTDRVPVLLPLGDSVRPELLTWGFLGFRGGKSIIINARSETAHEKQMFRNSLNSRRCIIPSTGFFEWGPVIINSEGKPENLNGDSQISLWETKPPSRPSNKTKKQKYLFSLLGEKVLYMAGLYNVFDGESRFVILTTKANSSVEDVHSRMPLILRAELINDWLFNSEQVEELLQESPILKKVAV